MNFDYVRKKHNKCSYFKKLEKLKSNPQLLPIKQKKLYYICNANISM